MCVGEVRKGGKYNDNIQYKIIQELKGGGYSFLLVLASSTQKFSKGDKTEDILLHIRIVSVFSQTHLSVVMWFTIDDKL